VLDEDFFGIGVVRIDGRFPAGPRVVQGDAPAVRVVVEGQQRREAAKDNPAPGAQESVSTH
jgi:hypothetical protein